jgi:hypothetical protein
VLIGEGVGRGGCRPVRLLHGNFESVTGLGEQSINSFPATYADASGTFVSIRKAGTALATVATDRALIEAVVGEMQDGIERAVGFWMDQIEEALRDPSLTTLGRMNAIQDIVDRYAERAGGSHGYAA